MILNENINYITLYNQERIYYFMIVNMKMQISKDKKVIRNSLRDISIRRRRGVLLIDQYLIKFILSIESIIKAIN